MKNPPHKRIYYALFHWYWAVKSIFIDKQQLYPCAKNKPSNHFGWHFWRQTSDTEFLTDWLTGMLWDCLRCYIQLTFKINVWLSGVNQQMSPYLSEISRAASSCHSVLRYLLSPWVEQLQDVSPDYIIRHKLIKTELFDTIEFSQVNAAAFASSFNLKTKKGSRCQFSVKGSELGLG